MSIAIVHPRQLAAQLHHWHSCIFFSKAQQLLTGFPIEEQGTYYANQHSSFNLQTNSKFTTKSAAVWDIELVVGTETDSFYACALCSARLCGGILSIVCHEQVRCSNTGRWLLRLLEHSRNAKELLFCQVTLLLAIS